MARSNYGFEKRQKEIKRKQKQEEKLERRRAQREATDQPPALDGAANADPQTPEGSPEPEGSVTDESEPKVGPAVS